jgi:hypothetical protein
MKPPIWAKTNNLGVETHNLGLKQIILGIEAHNLGV